MPYYVVNSVNYANYTIIRIIYKTDMTKLLIVCSLVRAD